MGCYLFTRPNNVAPASGPDNGTEHKVIACNPGDQLLLRCRYAENYINATTAPAATQWEGPYLRIYPALPNLDERDGMAKQIGKSTDVAATSGGNISPGGSDRLYYEIDAINQGAIYLPFACEVTMYTNLSGSWLFDVYKWDAGSWNFSPKELGGGYAQTRTARVGQARNLFVPLGCREFSLTGVQSNSPPSLASENTGKTVVLGSSSFLFGGLPATVQTGRFPIMGMRQFTLNNPPADPVAVTFWCYF